MVKDFSTLKAFIYKKIRRVFVKLYYPINSWTKLKTNGNKARASTYRCWVVKLAWSTLHGV